MENIWEFKEYNEAVVDEICKDLGVSRLVSCLLVQRGITNLEEARYFLKAGLEHLTSPLVMQGMSTAVERINRALTAQEKIFIYGDYDVDGVCSIVILKECLERLGGQVDYYVPNRFSEGYGLNIESIEILADQGCQLLITVDCGISSVNETQFANCLGIDVIITDHHTPPAIQPPALAVINPKNDDLKAIANLAGAGVAFKLACALIQERMAVQEAFQWLDLLALATIADVVPLLDENRILVKYGLPMLVQSKRLGLKALIGESGLESKTIEGWQVGFILAPRLNSAGRMDSARTSVELLGSKDEQHALQLAARLCQLNNERRQVEEFIYQEAVKAVESEPELAKMSVLVVGGERWHQGVIGIVAARLAETYNRPAVVISWEGSSGKGSSRSIDGFNLYQALEKTRDYLMGFGGHRMAAGLSIHRDQLLDFQNALQQYAETIFIEPQRYKRLRADMEIEEGDIQPNLIDELNILRPFGEGNPIPCFVLRSSEIFNPLRIGNNRAHLKFKTSRNIEAIIFNRSDIQEGLLQNCAQDLLFEMGWNDFRGKRNLQLKVKDIKSTFIDYQPKKGINHSFRLAKAVKRAVEETEAGRPVVFVYPTYRSLLKHQAVMQYFFNRNNLVLLHGHLHHEMRNLAQNQLVRGTGKVFLITNAFLTYYHRKFVLPDNLRYLVRMWPSAGQSWNSTNYGQLEMDTLDQVTPLVFSRSDKITAAAGHIWVYANKPATVKYWNNNYSGIRVESGILDMIQRRAVRRTYAGTGGIILSDGTHTAGVRHIGKIDKMILADSPLGLYEMAAFTDYLPAGQEISAEVTFAKNDLSYNRRYLERLYPRLETVSGILNIWSQYKAGSIKNLDDLTAKIEVDSNQQYSKLEISSAFRILADLDLCRVEKSGSIMPIYSDYGELSLNNMGDAPYCMEGSAEKQILTDWEIELNKVLVW